jgi:hypothetical protein
VIKKEIKRLDKAEKLQTAKMAANQNTKYVSKKQRIYEATKVLGYETPTKSDRSFAKLEAERVKRRDARFI